MSINNTYEITEKRGTYFNIEHPNVNWVKVALSVASLVLGILSMMWSSGGTAIGLAGLGAYFGGEIISAYQKYGSSPFHDAQTIAKFLERVRKEHLRPFDSFQVTPWEMVVAKCAHSDSMTMDDLRKLALLNEADQEIAHHLKGADQGGENNPKVYLALKRLRSFVKEHPVTIVSERALAPLRAP